MSKDLSFKRMEKANDKTYEELVHELEEEKLYLSRLHQQGKNEHAKMTSNILDLTDELEFTQNLIAKKEELLKTYEKKNPNKRRFFR
ncbi:MAG: hypothetical protein GTO02_07910 [Candidatus Dadabacteria bacterium]|nr:hypothetical protein [Candidatus Dadabacteria bacterium]